MTYYIYEVPGEKNGATHRWEVRSRENFEQYEIEPVIVETMEGPDTEDMWQVVGDREWELADLNGYARGTHYVEMCKRARLVTFESRSKGGTISGAQNVASGHFASLKTKEHQSYAGRQGGLKNIESGHLDSIIHDPIIKAKRKETNLKNTLIKYNKFLNQLPSEFKIIDGLNVCTRKQLYNMKLNGLIEKTDKWTYKKTLTN